MCLLLKPIGKASLKFLHVQYILEVAHFVPDLRWWVTGFFLCKVLEKEEEKIMMNPIKVGIEIF